MPDPRVVLDASALVAWACKEREAQAVARLLPVAVVPTITLAEAAASARLRGSRFLPEDLVPMVDARGAVIEPVIEADVLPAANLITYSRAHPAPDGGTLSLADACCIAVAERLELPLVADDSLWPTMPIKVPVHNFRD